MMKKRLFIFVFVAAMSCVWSTAAYAADRYWVGNSLGCDLTFDDTDCWSTTSGGSNGASVPGTADRAIFDSNDTRPCTIDTNTSVGTIWMTNGYNSTLNAGSVDLSIDDDLIIEQNGGTFTASSFVVRMGRDMTIYDASQFVNNGGTVTFETSSNTDVTTTIGRLDFEDVTIDKSSAGTDVVFEDIRIDGHWYLRTGQIFSVGTTTIESRGTVDWSTVTSSSINRPNIDFINTADVTINSTNFLGNIVVDNSNKSDLVVSVGDIGTEIFMESLYIVNGGTFDNSDFDNDMDIQSTVSVQLDAGEFITGTGNIDARNLLIQGGTFTNQAALLRLTLTSSSIQVSSGTFNGGTNDIDINGTSNNASIDVNGGTFISTTADLISFCPGSAQVYLEWRGF